MYNVIALYLQNAIVLIKIKKSYKKKKKKKKKRVY